MSMPSVPIPIRVSWEEAAEVLRRLAEGRLGGSGSAVVGITGPVGAGKTRLARRVSPCILATDDYLPDYAAVPFEERDDPERADLESLAEHVLRLRAGHAVEAPVWSFHSHRREGVRRVEPGRVVVCEGLHALHKTVARHVDVAAFVDAPAEVRWERWKAIAARGERGWSVEETRRFFEEVAEPAYARRRGEYLARADVIVMNG